MNKIIGKSDITLEEIAEIFDIDISVLKGIKILVCLREVGSCDDSVFCLFEKRGKLFSVHAHHCSWDDFEGQWYPEETSWKALKRYDMSSYEDAEGYPEFLVLLESKASFE